uniref:SH3 and multiple ankyrin repeat domains 3b n=1 Tax=Salarias fasciatus TaxID=181472 RepID=A0A672GJX6_SALFA
MLKFFGINLRNDPVALICSDYVIEEKTAVLQKRESEGFGFVLRGAKAETPIEEFAPTPAFPALQYLESVDQGGVAWRAGLRTGDFLIEVNGSDVVKVGHRQVVSLIRQGGSRLLMKVVSVSRKSESNLIRKKAPPPPKRAPSTSLTLRSKSMTADLEEIEVKPQKLIMPVLLWVFFLFSSHLCGNAPHTFDCLKVTADGSKQGVTTENLTFDPEKRT